MSSIASILARFFLSAFFLISGINKIIYWREADKQFMHTLSDWQAHLASVEYLQTLLNEGVAWSPIVLLLMTFIEILGGLFLLFGIKERLGAFFLLLCLIPSTLFFHPFWFFHGIEQELQMSLFLRNIAIIGGLLLVIAHGLRRNASGERFPCQYD